MKNKPILCRIGIHKWLPEEQVFIEESFGAYKVRFDCKCRRCDAVKTKISRFGALND